MYSVQRPTEDTANSVSSLNYLLWLWVPARTQLQPTLRAAAAGRKQSRACLPQLGPARPGLLCLGIFSKSVSLSLTLPSWAKLPHWQAGGARTKDWPMRKSHHPASILHSDFPHTHLIFNSLVFLFFFLSWNTVNHSSISYFSHQTFPIFLTFTNILS